MVTAVEITRAAGDELTDLVEQGWYVFAREGAFNRNDALPPGYSVLLSGDRSPEPDYLFFLKGEEAVLTFRRGHSDGKVTPSYISNDAAYVAMVIARRTFKAELHSAGYLFGKEALETEMLNGETTLEQSRKRMESKIYDNWNALTAREAMADVLPAGFTAHINNFFDGGEIKLFAAQKHFVTVSREVKFRRIAIAIDIPQGFQKRDAQVLQVLDMICDKTIERAKEMAREAHQKEQEAENAEAYGLLDNFNI